uniref:Transposable element Tcb1 transposase n=1 Tax=Bactrocera dorsalis TaxID=27457 RepID=A0A034VWQ1_BACDO
MCINDRFQHVGTINSTFYETAGVKITTSSIQNVLNSLGFRARRPAKKPLLIIRMKKYRLEWVKLHKTWTTSDWGNVIFSDESKFNLLEPDGNGTVRRRKRGTFFGKLCLAHRKAFPLFNGVGAVTKFGVGPLIILKRSVNSEI